MFSISQSGLLDTIVIGAGSAGLSAALVLGRARRQVLVLDGGPPRNASADAAHGFLTRDGTPPAELLQIARAQLTPYPVQLMRAQAERAHATQDGFEVRVTGGAVHHARRLVLATGVTDVLPDLPGLQEGWGHSVHHCPYCHGWEVRDQALADLVPAGGDAAYHRGVLLRQWTPDLTVLTHGGAALSDDQQVQPDALGVRVDARPVAAWTGSAVVFQDGSTLARHALFVTPTLRQRADLPDQLGCERAQTGPMPGVLLRVQPESGLTSVPGVYAAGDLAGEQQVLLAAASGARAAYAINAELSVSDARRAAQPAIL